MIKIYILKKQTSNGVKKQTPHQNKFGAGRVTRELGARLSY